MNSIGLPQTFSSRITQRARELNSLLCVGLDPHFAIGSISPLQEWGLNIVEQTQDLAVAYKPNIAFYEAQGIVGHLALKATLAAIRRLQVPVILDWKRADIGSTAEYYATAAYEYWEVDATTLIPYMGIDALVPSFQDLPSFKREGKASFIVCRTTNPGRTLVQDLQTPEGRPGYLVVADAVKAARHQGFDLGLVVGASDTVAMKEIRELDPSVWFLTPGVGAQGGNLPEVLKAGLREDGLGMLVSISRGISQHQNPRERALYYTQTIRDLRSRKGT